MCFGNRAWKTTGDAANHMLSRKYLGRLITHDEDARKITGYMSSIGWSIQSFVVGILGLASGLFRYQQSLIGS